MKLRYLPTSEFGLRWMRSYYLKNPQLNRRAASVAMKVAEQTLMSFPYSGQIYEAFEDVREFHIQGTAFAFLYTVSRDCVWIIDVRDTRGNRSAEALREFVSVVRKRNGLL
jgi:plasmid stabilization system protein ParE